MQLQWQKQQKRPHFLYFSRWLPIQNGCHWDKLSSKIKNVQTTLEMPKNSLKCKKKIFYFSRWPPIQNGCQGVSHLEISKMSKICLEMLKMSKNAKKKFLIFSNMAATVDLLLFVVSKKNVTYVLYYTLRKVHAKNETISFIFKGARAKKVKK